jgi:hypothetical protein
MTWTTADWSNNLHPQSDQCVFYFMSYADMPTIKYPIYLFFLEINGLYIKKNVSF